MMRIAPTLALAATLLAPALARAETWSAAPLVDKMCSAKVKANPDAHPTSCLLQCAASGYGLLKPDGSWVPFDQAGNQKALAALKATTRKDHVRVDVTGDLKGGVIAVQSLTISG